MKQCVYQVFQFIWHYWMMYVRRYGPRSILQDASVSSQFGYPHIVIKYVNLMRKKTTSQERLQCHQHAIGTGDRAGVRMNALYYVSVSPSEILVIHSWSNYQKAVLNATWRVFGLLGMHCRSNCEIHAVKLRAYDVEHLQTSGVPQEKKHIEHILRFECLRTSPHHKRGKSNQGPLKEVN